MLNNNRIHNFKSFVTESDTNLNEMSYSKSELVIIPKDSNEITVMSKFVQDQFINNSNVSEFEYLGYRNGKILVHATLDSVPNGIKKLKKMLADGGQRGTVVEND